MLSNTLVKLCAGISSVATLLLGLDGLEQSSLLSVTTGRDECSLTAEQKALLASAVSLSGLNQSCFYNITLDSLTSGPNLWG